MIKFCIANFVSAHVLMGKNKNLFPNFRLVWFLYYGSSTEKFQPNRFFKIRFLLADFYCKNTFSLLDCSSQRFNLAFLVDGSGSIEQQGQGNFQRSKDFIIGLVRTLEIGRDEVNVATVLYWHSYRIVHRLDTFFSQQNIETAIQAMSYPSGGTRTGQGLDVIRTMIFSNLGADREQLPKVVVVLTDGLSQDNVAGPAQALRNTGVTIIAVGVGCCFYRPELNLIATDPDEDHVYSAGFTALGKITHSLRKQICLGKKTVTATFLVSICKQYTY